MIQTLLGKKLNQTQKFLENGRRIPVTEVAVSDNVVLQAKTVEKDNYLAVQLGYGVKKSGTKPVLGHVKKAGLDKAPAFVKEVRVKDANDLPQAGDLISVETVFKPGDIVDVTGTSKGKGFAGVVKRHNFRGGPKTHGQSDRHRAPGSIGQTTTPGRVYRGKRMAGHMGVDTVTMSNLTVVDVDAVNKKLYILGLVPGHKDSYLLITQKGEDKKFVPLLKFVEEAEVASNAMGEEVSEEATSNVAEPEVVEEQPEVQVSEEVKEVVEGSAVQEPVESVKEKVEEEVAAEEGAKSEEKVDSVQEESGEPREEEK